LKEGKILATSLIVSILAELFLVYIIYYNQFKIVPIYDSELQVWLNALFNSLSAICLAIAVVFIKQKKRNLHILWIHFAVRFSSLFLINYIFYHMSVGHVVFNNQSWRTVYLLILASHLLTSVICLPMIFTTYSLGVFGYLEGHKKLAKWTFILWEYVSVTGVTIVLMLKFLNS
jgi:putative membrane protein